jgi:hypothetical protein
MAVDAHGGASAPADMHQMEKGVQAGYPPLLWALVEPCR